jgi:hypothetical protein
MHGRSIRSTKADAYGSLHAACWALHCCCKKVAPPPPLFLRHAWAALQIDAAIYTVLDRSDHCRS